MENKKKKYIVHVK